MIKIDTVIFDMNGVISNDEHVQEMSTEESLKEFNIDLEDNWYNKYFIGKTDHSGFKSILKAKKLNIDVNELVKLKIKYFRKYYPLYKKDYDGVIDAIDRISKRYKIAIASASNRIEMEIILTTLKVRHYFDFTVSGDDVLNGKPHPEAYLKAINLLNSKASNSVAIEDSRNGVKAAKAAGMACIAITNTHLRENLIDVNPDIIVDKFREIDYKLIENLEIS